MSRGQSGQQALRNWSPDNPDELLRVPPPRKISVLLPHQREVMRSYAEGTLEMSDIALQLPTGSGHNVGRSAYREWRRRKDQERVHV